MDMRDEWLPALKAWAESNANVLELWLFGSRAKGGARPDSDIDIALLLMPPRGKHNWALAAFIEFFDDWKAELKEAVAWDVSLVAIGPDFDMNDVVRNSGVRLWRRE